VRTPISFLPDGVVHLAEAATNDGHAAQRLEVVAADVLKAHLLGRRRIHDRGDGVRLRPRACYGLKRRLRAHQLAMQMGWDRRALIAGCPGASPLGADSYLTQTSTEALGVELADRATA
jgi:hypothetical protein